MPIYECPVCRRRVEKPLGVYYCIRCGATMYEVREVPYAPERLYREMRDEELIAEFDRLVHLIPTPYLRSVMLELNRRFPEYGFERLRYEISSLDSRLIEVLGKLKERIKKPAS